MIIDMDSNVGSCIGRSGYVNQRVGIELEYEGCNMKKVGETTLMKWGTSADHSLRKGGLEFVSKPLPPELVAEQAKIIMHEAKRIGARATKRCGLHVHVNASHLTWRQLFSFCTYYALLEPSLFKDYASGREMSHFCVPTWTNTVLAEMMYSDGQRLRQGIALPSIKKEDWSLASEYFMGSGGGGGCMLSMLSCPKYAALNVSSLKKFGTIEFRQTPSTLDPEFVTQWAMLLLKIQEEASKYSEPAAIVREYDSAGLLTLCERVGYSPKGTVDELDQEDAVDTATLIAGHVPVNWKQLNWEIG